MANALLDVAREAVDVAKKLGADDAWISASRNHSVNFEMRDGKLETVQDSTSRGLAVRLWVDGRYSAHNTTDLRPAQVESFLTEAIAITRALQKDPFRSIPDPALFEGRSTRDLELVDTSILDLSREHRMDILEKTNARLQGKDKVLSSNSFTGTSHSQSASASTNGFKGSYESTNMFLGANVTLSDNDKRPEESHFAVSLHRDQLPDPGQVADEALRRANARLGSIKGPTQLTTMVVDPRVAGSIVGRLLASLDGGSLQQGRSFWANKVGTKCVSDQMSIVDDPLVVRGLSSRPFDGEGIAAKPMPIIEDGVLRNYYIDTYYGKKLSMNPTTGFPSNRIMKLGNKDMRELIKDVGSGVLVTSWLGGNSDGTSGDFSLGVRGHLIERGTIAGPVGEMNITGNLLSLFSSLRVVGNDPWKYSALKVPTLVFDKVSFSGA
jgi:PmbA protein